MSSDAELRALVAAATVQPWATNGLRVECRDDHGWVNDGWIIGDLDGPDAEANAALIVAAVNALPALLDRLEAAERDIARKGQQLDHLLSHCRDDECMTCGTIICEHGEPLHFHHDGCPACVFAEMERQQNIDAAREGEK